MKIEEQNSPELRSLAEHIEGSRSAMLTMCDAQGHLSSQPMTVIEMDGQGCLWMLISKSGHTARMAAEGSAMDTVNLAFSDESRSTFISVTARATLSHDKQRKEGLWSVMARPWFPLGAEDPDLAALRLEPIKAEIWNGPDSSVLRMIAMAASVVAGKPLGLGDHENHALKPES
jgi:general stress protein 26